MMANYAKTAPVYFEAGWSPLPLPARQKSSPPTGTTGADGIWPNLSDVQHWCKTDGEGNVALRVPKGVVGIDVDDYDDKHGGRSLAELEAKYGALPPTWVSTSRGFGVSSIRLYRIPEGVRFSGQLAEHIEAIQHHHRYLVAAPSIHPNGERYRWYDPQGERATRPPYIHELAELPEAWVEGLRIKPQAPTEVQYTRPIAIDSDADDSIADHIRRTYDWHQLLTQDGWTLTETKSDSTLWRRPGKDHDHSARLYEPEGPLVVFTSHLQELQRTWAETRDREGDFWKFSLFGYIAATRYDGDRSECARDHRRKLNEANRPLVVLPAYTGTGELSTDIWSERPVLAHIRDAAHSRMVAPYAVFGCVAARIAAFTHPSTCLPPTIGGRAPLSLYIALHGASGAGKSSPVACAADLIPETPLGCVGPLGLGSGEGLVEAFMDLLEEEDGAGKKRKVKRQAFRGALFTLDEGQMLAEIGSRKGSTILPVLRTAWSGDDPGQANASIETRRSLRKGSYHVGLISLWQDKAGAALIADADGGTPQRFIWLPTTDPNFPDEEPDWPGEIDIDWPASIAVDGVVGYNPLRIPQDIIDEIKRLRREVLRGNARENPLDAHRRLNKLKLAGVLAIMDGRRDIDHDDWRIAEHFMCISDTVREMVLDRSREQYAQQVKAEANRYAIRETIVQDATVARALARAAKAVWRAVDKCPDGATRRDLHHAITSRDRALVSVEEAAEEAIRLQWVTVDGDRWKPGKARPT